MNLSTLFLLLEILSFVLAGAVVALAGIAKLTSTDRDDKLLEILRKVQTFLSGIVIPKSMR